MNFWSAFWTRTGTVLLLLLAFVALGRAEERREIRVDTFDARGNRTGYVIVNPKSGRVDAFDARSNRTGHGVITPAPSTGSGSTTTTAGSTSSSGSTRPSAPSGTATPPWRR